MSAGARVDARLVLRTLSDRPRSAARRPSRLRRFGGPRAPASLSSFAHRVTRESADRSLPARRKRASRAAAGAHRTSDLSPATPPRLAWPGFLRRGQGAAIGGRTSDAMIDRSKARSKPLARRSDVGAKAGVWPSVVGQARFLTGSARVHASTGRHAGEDLAFERHLAGAERSPLFPPQTRSGL